MKGSKKENIDELPGDRVYVCPSCTVVRYGDRKQPCPVCGFDGAPDRVSLE
jgi:rubrerythrin